MKKSIHTNQSRGTTMMEWLNSKHTFSFGEYRNSERHQFGVLRVLNDDIVAPGKGFGAHQHHNMEIISIPLYGDLKHKDSTGREAIIKEGDIQVMSAGSGITHSEMNAKADDDVKFLQIWVIPNKRNVEPRYQQISISTQDSKNQLIQIVSPNADDDGVWIYQNAWFHLGRFDKDHITDYKMKNPENGLYCFVIEGALSINDMDLDRRDGIGITETDKITITSKGISEFLLMEVPMENQ